jgi:capsular exopolysaccharide synthesis family protein
MRYLSSVARIAKDGCPLRYAALGKDERMSRVFRALEKAEEENKQKVKGESSPEIFEIKPELRREEPILKFPEERIEGLGLPSKEEVPILIVPPNSFAAEEFRKLKTQIFLRLPNPPHSILVTSTMPQEGKTMTAVNLAVAISQEIQMKAILIDGDLRKPGIHLGKSHHSKGLSSYLSDRASLSEILIDTEIENLRVVQAGHLSKKSPELIGSKKMGVFLKSLRESGDNTYIIIDSPPIISTTEPTLLSKMVDGIILVVMADRAPRESIQRAIKSIDRQKIIGVVFNQIDLKPSSYYSKYYYGYGKK